MLGSRLRIRTIEELDRWLEENCWFEDGYVLSLWPKPSPSGNQPPSRATLQLAYQVSGGWEAGDTRILRVFGVEAIGVREWSTNTPDSYLPDHCMEGIERIETGEGLGLIFDVPGPVSLICSELVIERQPDRTEPIKPRPSDREFSAIVPSRTRPSPTEWIEWLRRLGLEAVWRRYGGEAEPASQVPDDYTGWLLQTPKRIGESQAGLFFFHCGPNQNGRSGNPHTELLRQQFSGALGRLRSGSRFDVWQRGTLWKLPINRQAMARIPGRRWDCLP